MKSLFVGTSNMYAYQKSPHLIQLILSILFVFITVCAFFAIPLFRAVGWLFYLIIWHCVVVTAFAGAHVNVVFKSNLCQVLTYWHTHPLRLVLE